MRLFLSVLAACLIGCSYPYGRVNYQPLPIDRLTIGMTKDQVKTAIGHPPYDYPGSKTQGTDTVEVWLYIKADHEWLENKSRVNFRYYLYFLNGQLTRWTNGGDWEKEATEILEIRLR